MQQIARHDSPLKTARFAHPVRNAGALGIEPGMQVADFGSGSGAYALLIAERLGNAGRVYAIDVQRDLLRRVLHESRRRGFQNVEVIWADLERPGASKIADGALDLVLISNLLFQVEDKRAVLAEAARVLRPFGELAIIDWSGSSGGMGPIESQIVTKEKARALAARAGFARSREFDAGSHHWGLLLRRAPPDRS